MWPGELLCSLVVAESLPRLEEERDVTRRSALTPIGLSFFTPFSHPKTPRPASQRPTPSSLCRWMIGPEECSSRLSLGERRGLLTDACGSLSAKGIVGFRSRVAVLLADSCCPCTTCLWPRARPKVRLPAASECWGSQLMGPCGSTTWSNTLKSCLSSPSTSRAAGPSARSSGRPGTGGTDLSDRDAHYLQRQKPLSF